MDQLITMLERLHRSVAIDFPCNGLVFIHKIRAKNGRVQTKHALYN